MTWELLQYFLLKKMDVISHWSLFTANDPVYNVSQLNLPFHTESTHVFQNNTITFQVYIVEKIKIKKLYLTSLIWNRQH